MKTYKKKSGNHSFFFTGAKMRWFLRICNQKTNFNKYFTMKTFALVTFMNYV